MKSFLGVDIGTTSTKAIAFSTSGTILGKGDWQATLRERAYEIISPQPSWAEQDPEVIFQAMMLAVREAVQNLSPKALGFSAAMHSLIAVDAENQLLTKAIIWADNRSVKQSQRLKQAGGQAIYERTGTPIHSMSPLTKLIWLREEAPGIYNQAAKFISIKEYIFYQLFGRYVVDYSIASATGLFNLKTLTWDKEALDIAGIHQEQLSEIVPTTEILQGMKLPYAEAMGLDAETPVVIGGSDGVLANLGVGAIASHQVAVTIGTSSAVRTIVDAPLTDPQMRTFCYALTEKHWAIGGASNNGGIVLRWWRDSFGGDLGYDEMIQAASEVPLGAEGLIFLPFLSGERSPLWNESARGVFFGVGINHKRSHFSRAVLEGIIYNVHSINLILGELVGNPQALIVSGGFARSSFWRQLLADISGVEVLLPSVYEASSFGAAILAMYAMGEIAALTDIQLPITKRHPPNPERHQSYSDFFSIYQRLYPKLEAEFTSLADVQHRFR